MVSFAFFAISFLLSMPLVFSVGDSKNMNVLFIAVDDLRPELGAYGHSMIKSPNIDELASKSMVFERAYCQVAVCSPSRASLLTGRRPDTNHVWKIAAGEYWRTYTNATTIPQYFKENGYISIGMGKIFHPGPASGNDDVKYSWSPESLPYFHATGVDADRTSWHQFNLDDSDFEDGKIADNAVTTLKALKQNETNGEARPFFLAVGFHKPHLPFYAPSEYFNLYPSYNDIQLPMNRDPPTGLPNISWSTWGELKQYTDIAQLSVKSKDCATDPQQSLLGDQCRLSDSVTRQLRRAYYSCVSFVDAQVGKVIKELEDQGLANNTIIVFLGDHGWQLGEHNEWCKQTNFEDTTHVPFMLHVPGVTDKGMRSKALVELIDIFPSLTELAGIKQPPLCPEDNRNLLACVEGTSVVPLLKNPDMTWKKAAFSQYPRPTGGLPVIPGRLPPPDELEQFMGYTVRVDQYRFTEWYKFDHVNAKPDWNSIVGTELYNHTNPVVFFNDENENLASKSEMKSVVEDLRKVVQAGWRSALPDNN